MKISLLLFLGILMLALPTCKQPTDPPPPKDDLDTTSHEYSWDSFIIGDGYSSVLYDVAIVQRNGIEEIIGVGELFVLDSMGAHNPVTYSIVRWDGLTWQPKRLFYDSTKLVVPIRGITMTSSSDFWLAAGSIFHWDGSSDLTELRFSRLMLPDPNMSIEKIFESAGGRLFGVGNAGTVVYSDDGISWNLTSTGIAVDFRDITGGPQLTIALASSPGETRILKLMTIGAEEYIPWPISDRLGSIWMAPHQSLYLGGFGVWVASDTSLRLVDGSPTSYFFRKIRGTESNDIVAVAWDGVLAHFNGNSWQVYSEIPSDFKFESVTINSNTIVAVGFTGGLVGNGASITVGRRYE